MREDGAVSSLPDPSTASLAPAGLRIEHVVWDDPRAQALRATMEHEMSAVYAGRHAEATPEQQAAIDRVLTVDPSGVKATVLVLDADGTPLAHAALRDHDGEWEMKRVIVLAEARGRGIGTLLMAELDEAARAGGARRIILQTGDRQPDAVRLYERTGYTPIPVFEPYVEAIPSSLCFEKVLVEG